MLNRGLAYENKNLKVLTVGMNFKSD